MMGIMNRDFEAWATRTPAFKWTQFRVASALGVIAALSAWCVWPSAPAFGLFFALVAAWLIIGAIHAVVT